MSNKDVKSLKETTDYKGKKIMVYDNSSTGSPAFIYTDFINELNEESKENLLLFYDGLLRLQEQQVFWSILERIGFSDEFRKYLEEKK